MAISDQLQMLISAFIFGLLFQATVAALLLYINGHVSTIFKDRRRLVLILFLTSSALWAQVDFINFAVPPTSPNACQVTIIASTFFDQAARVIIGGFLLWSVGHVKKTPVENSGLCALMGIRIVMGAIFVGYARPQFAPVCVARSDFLPASVAVMVLDMIIVGVVAIRVFTLGLLDVIREVRSSTKQEQSKALVYCTGGLLLWMLTSAAMMVGMPSIALLLRTALPAIGLIILVSILTIHTGALVLPQYDDSTTPEARSPFVAPPSLSSSSLSNDDGSPIRENGYTRTANLFVVNPSDTPHDSSVMTYLEDVKAENNRYAGHRSAGVGAVNEENVDSFNAGEVASNRASSGVFQSLSAATLEAISSAAFLAAPRQAPVPSPATRIDQTRALPVIDSSTSETRQKRARFGWSKKPADRSVHKIVISNPVMDDVESQSAQPFARMRTIDLATAATSERERRELAINRQLVAKRPAPPPPVASEAWRKSSSTRRKEIPRGISVPMTLNISEKGSNGSRLSVAVNANSTSASLSPGREDVRRRSPRSIKTLEGDIEKAHFLASRPNTIAAPKGESQQTVMFVNDIVYDNPGMVKSIIKQAPTALGKSKSEPQRKPDTSLEFSSTQSDSIMHRPRPYRRDSEQDRVIFPSQPSPHHKRSKSSPSKSIPQSPFSTFTDVPTLPQRPTTAAGLRKLLPNDTHSITVDKKISSLFPAPPGVHHIHNRRSSVPSLPRIPSSILLGYSFAKMLTDQEVQEHRASTISFGSQIQNDGITPIAETPIINENGIYRFSANTYRTLAGSPRDSRIPELPDKVQNTEDSNSNAMQLQASNSRRHSAVTNSSSEADGSHDDSKSAWASIHSPVPAIDVITVQTAHETYIRMRKDAGAKSNGDSSMPSFAPFLKAEDERNVIGDGGGFMTMIFGMDDVAPPSANMRSFLWNLSPVIPDNEVFLPPANDTWHKRIGDELPAFSQRRKDLRSRTMPPPTPLLLGSNKSQRPVAREPMIDQEEDSPEKALKEIQAQLSKFEVASRESLKPSIHHMPQECPKSPRAVLNDRLGLLANLEIEMGQQETLWMRMQHNFDRDSNSTIMTPQITERTPRELPSPPSETSSRRASRSVDRRLRTRSKDEESSSASVTRSPHTTRANIWQQRLAEAQTEFIENAPALLGPGNVNFLLMSRAQLGSPTPPDSVGSGSDSGTEMDYDTDEEIYDRELTRATPLSDIKRMALWEPKPSAVTVRVGHLWSPANDISTVRNTSSEPAAKGLRPVQRRDQHALTIVSSSLWSKPTLHANRPPIGLWGSRMTRPKTIMARPKAQKPQKKSKRVTFLPDILENPSPLPHKGGTLGIFQFPWGEKSDSAVYDPIPVPNRASLGPFVLNSSFESKPTQSDPEPAEYSSSFFDDYGEDYEGASEVNSDDDFDESTLWEIATLLDSQDVPSRNSLFPCPRIIEDYDDEDDSEPDVTESTSNPNQSTGASGWPAMVKFTPVRPLKPLPLLPMSEESDDCEKTQAAAERNSQVASAPIWQAYLPALDDAVRGSSCEAVNPKPRSRPKVDARVLWDKAIGAVSSLPVEKAVALWTQQSSGTAKKSSLVPGHGTLEEISQTTLWTPRETQIVTQVVGLFTAGVQREDYHQHHQAPAALTMFRKPRIDTTPLPALSFQQLWSPRKKSSSECHWISLSSVRAPSPSLCSTSSSGRSSPSSDEESVASANTKASSLASPDLRSAADLTKAAWWEASASSTAMPTAVNEGQLAAVDTVDPSSTSPILLRGSKVLASRDLWESRAPVLDSTATKKTWRSSKTIVSDAFQENKRKATTAAIMREEDSALAEATRAVIDYDAAVRHPVFFPSSMISSAAYVHPAATGHVARPATSQEGAQKPSQLWASTPLIASQAPSSGLLWSKPQLAEKHNSSPWTPLVKDTAVRKTTKDLPPLILPTLSSTSFWRATTSTISSAQHWLHAAALRSVPASPTTTEQSPLSMLLANTFLAETPAPSRTET